jgi:hypothetical protein
MNPIDRIFAGLKADIDIILDGLNGIVDLCSSETKRLENQETLWPVEVEGLGKYVHDYVNGLEDLFVRISKKIDQDVPAGPHWHRDLILRMAKEIPGVRPPVIDEGLKAVLFEYAGFRHVFRHSYLTGIKWDRLKPLCERLPGLNREIKTNLRDFFSTLESSTR